MHKFYTILLTVVFFLAFRPADADIVLNELVMSNGSVLGDNAVYPDYREIIEIYNNGTEDVNLGGYGLTNNDKVPLKWTFPAITLESGERLFVKASEKDKAELYHYERDTFYLHTNFRLSATGDFVGLSDPSGNFIDSVYTEYVPRDMSYGRYPDGTGDWHYFPAPSIDRSNTSPAYPDRATSLVNFDKQGGRYENDVTVSMSAESLDDSIYFTLDGSEPDMNDYLYSGEIKIESTTVLRARVIEEGHLPGEITSSSYLINEDAELPVISIVTDPDNLWDDDIGIYTNGNYTNRGGEWERFSNFEFFDEDGTKHVDMPIGLRIHGGFTRQIIPQKSLRVYARGGYASYGSGTLDHKFFEHRDADEFNRIILRQSGNDWNSTMFRSAFQQILLRPLDIEFREYTPTAVYLNGEYWGIHNIRDRDDKYFVSRERNVDPDSIYMIDNRRKPTLGGWDARIEYIELRDKINDLDLSIDSNYEKIADRIDIDNKITFYTSYVYANNHDWPGNNNIKYRSINPEGKWRWIFKDFDFGFALWQGNSAYQNDMLYTALEDDYWANQWWSRIITPNLLENENFKHKFINRFADHLNSYFLPERVNMVINRKRDMIEDEIPNHINRWGHLDGQFDDLRSLSEWESNIDRMRNFADLRPAHQRQHIKNYFNISTTHDLTLDVDTQNDSIEVGEEVYGGRIRLNDHITIDEDLFTPGNEMYPWTGEYFDKIPLRLEAIPEEGYTFSHWTGDKNSQDEVIEISPESDKTLIAVFEQDLSNVVPEAHKMSHGEYLFYEWSPKETPGTYPSNMIFEETSEQDPKLDTEMQEYWELGYDKDNRSRINGLNDTGFSFINTSNPNEGGGYLGSAVLALNTKEQDTVYVSWDGGTISPNSREYAIRLQYRLGHTGPFYDFIDENGNNIEYNRNEQAGHDHIFGPYKLPAELLDKAYVQLRWRYYYIDTGVSGPRAELNIDRIHVFLPGELDLPEKPQLVYPAEYDTTRSQFPDFVWQDQENSSYFELEIAEDSHFNEILEQKSLEDTTVKLDKPLNFNSAYFWRVRAVNSSGPGDWSAHWEFNTPVLDIPEKVILINPEDEEKQVEHPVSFVWHEVADTPAVYHLEIAENIDMENSISFETEDTTRSIPLGSDNRYYWRVKAENEVGTGEWSEIRTFETTFLSTPGEITLVSPEYEANIDTEAVELVWNKAPLANDYELVLATDALFNDVIDQKMVKDTSVVINDLEPESAYWWRVRGHNQNGFGHFSERRTFNYLLTSVQKEFQNKEPEVNIYPNPFEDKTNIELNLPQEGEVRIKAFSIGGQLIEKVHSGYQENGKCFFEWNAENMSPGIYILKIVTPGTTVNERVIID